MNPPQNKSQPRVKMPPRGSEPQLYPQNKSAPGLHKGYP